MTQRTYLLDIEKWCRTLLYVWALMSQPLIYGNQFEGDSQEDPPLSPQKNILVEYFTADTLEPGEFKAGFELEFSPMRDFMIGTTLWEIQ